MVTYTSQLAGGLSINYSDSDVVLQCVAWHTFDGSEMADGSDSFESVKVKAM